MKSKIYKKIMKIQIMVMMFVFSSFVLLGQVHEGELIDKSPQQPGTLGVIVNSINVSTVTPTDMVEAIIGIGVTYSNVSYTGADTASGLFTEGISSGLGLDEGVILSSGYAVHVQGPNQSGSISAELGIPGDADLDALIPQSTNDASVLEFDFVPTDPMLEIRFVFGSDEYNEYVGSNFNDVFAFFLDGVNIALIPGTSIPVSINNVNNGSFPSYYVDNTTGIHDTEMDGFTTLIIGTAAVTPGQTHHIKLAIADAGDSSLDSWVLIEGESFGAPPPVPLSNWGIVLVVVLIGLVLWFRRGKLFF